MPLHAVLAFSLFETLALAGVLLAWADRVAGARLLAVFLVGIATWIAGNEAPIWLGPEAEPLMMGLLATAPFTSAFFFHFCVVFCRVDVGRKTIAAAYALGAISTLVAELGHPAHMEPGRHIAWIAVAEPLGWGASVAWIVLGSGGVAVLLAALARARPPAFSQIAAVSASCLWGLACLAGYGMEVSGLTVYPFPLLGLPLYPVILVYGILRYGVFVANAWARRALVWTLLLAFGAGVVALTPLLPFESRWLGGLVVAASCLALNGPLRRLAERLVYPGGTVTATDLAHWRVALQAADSPGALAKQAATLLAQRIGLPVAVRVGDEGTPAAGDLPLLVCTHGPQGWQATLVGWDAAPPGPRHAAELFGSIVAEAAARVEQTEQAAGRERERQLQALLAELGALAATVAHDIRNPLNIIAMAVAGAPAHTRREVADQVARIANLSRDLLDYAKPWKLATARVDLAAQVRAAAARLPEVTLGDGLAQALPVDADPRRIDQALANLLENARTAAADPGTAGARARVHVDAEATPQGLRLHVCDDGPGVPDEIRARLFEPFASRSPGGTGLGLAIVARVMAAHGGSVALTERPPWRTCFTLTFPNAT
ncbi:MAG: sensor histidine kinase [Burkholderiaceae bacterium]